MFYVSDASAESKGIYSVTDTDDGVTEQVAKEQLLSYVQSGIKIEGVSKTSDLIYPMYPTDTTPSKFMYLGRRIGDSPFDCVITSDYVRDVNKFSVPYYPVNVFDLVQRKGFSPCLLTAHMLENGEVVSYPVAILEDKKQVLFSDRKEIPVLKVRLYKSHGYEDKELRCYVYVGRLHWDFSIFSYIDINEAEADIHRRKAQYGNNRYFAYFANLGEVLDKIRKFILKYKCFRVSSVLSNTYAHWDDGKGLVYLSDTQTVPASELLFDMCDLIRYAQKTDDSIMYIFQTLPECWVGDQMRYPIFSVLSELFFDNKELSIGTSDFIIGGSRGATSKKSTGELMSSWTGRVEVSRHDCFHDELYCISHFVKRSKIQLMCNTSYTTDLDNFVKEGNDRVITSLYGVYDIRLDEFLDSIGRGKASASDSKTVLKTKLLTGNTTLTMNAKKEVSGLRALKNGVLMLPEGGKVVVKDGMDINNVYKICIPKGYTQFKTDAVKFKEVPQVANNFLISSEATAPSLMMSLVNALFGGDGYYSNKLKAFDGKRIDFESKTAVSQTIAGLLYSDKVRLPPVKCKNLYLGIYRFIRNASESDRKRAIEYVYDRCYENGKLANEISFINSSFNMEIADFSIYSHLKLPTLMRSAMLIAKRVHVVSDGLLAYESPAFAKYINCVDEIEITMRSAALSALRNAGYVRGGYIKISRKQGEDINKRIFGETDYSIGDDDIGW